MPNIFLDELGYASIQGVPRSSNVDHAMSQSPAGNEEIEISFSNVAHDHTIPCLLDQDSAPITTEMVVPRPKVEHPNLDTSIQVSLPGTADADGASLWSGSNWQSDKPAGKIRGNSPDMTPASLEVAVDIIGEPVTALHSKYSYHEKADHGTFVAETSSESLEPARYSDGPVLIPDFTDYTNYDDDEGDDASIHHGSENDTISVADYQNERLLDENTQGLVSNSERNHPTPGEGVLPAHLNDLLERWYARHGRHIPKCVYRRSKDSMSDLWCRHKSREPAIWLHSSGVPLDVTWYYLPGASLLEDRNENHSPKLIVVSGPGVAPSIVTYKNAGGSIAGVKDNGVVYKVWRGLDGDRDGFETSPSVIKMSRSLIGSTTSKNASAKIAECHPTTKGTITTSGHGQEKRCNFCIMQRRGCDGRRPTCGTCASTGRSCLYHYTSISRTQLEEMIRSSSSSSDGKIMQRSERARKPNAKYASEELAPSKKRKAVITPADEDDDEQSDVLLSTFMNSPPLTIATPSASSHSTQPVRWACYLCDVVRNEKQHLRYHIKTYHGIDTVDEARMRSTNRRTLTARASSSMKLGNPKKMQNLDQTRIAPEVQSTAELHTRRAQATKQANVHVYGAELDKHIKKNATLIFFSLAQAPRTRLFAACDSVHKLFAQATAGSVFTREKARVLAIEVEDVEGELPVVEEDEEDFQHFVTQLKNASCWTVKNGQVQGDTIIFVREKRK